MKSRYTGVDFMFKNKLKDMTLVAVGVNHKQTPIALREKLVFSPEVAHRQLSALVQQTPISEALILSTCNRTELYCHADDPGMVHQWLHDLCVSQSQDHSLALYEYLDQCAVQHIMRVATGLDSMVLGEPQIFGQLKSAFHLADDAGSVGTELRRLFQYVFSVTKQIRTKTKIGAHPISVAFVAVNIAKQIFSDLSKCRVLLIGSGQTIGLAASYLKDRHVKCLRVAGRTKAKAMHVAERYGGEGIALSEISSVLPESDIIISATASPLPILGKGSVETALKRRKHRPILMLDIAMPRDIEPEVAELEDVYLYNVDDLDRAITDGLAQRQHAAKQAETIIDAYVEFYRYQLKALTAVDLICAYRQKLETARDAQVAVALQQLHAGESPEHIISQLGRNLTNHIMHEPSVQLRQACLEGQVDVLSAAKQLFDLEEL